MSEENKPVCLAICMPIARAVHPDTMRDLMRLDVPKPYHWIDVIGYPVGDARNMIAERALAIPEVTHLMWIDDDMRFQPGDVKKLLAHDLPVVGGLCHGRRHPYPPILIYKSEYGCSYRYDYPKGLVKVDATGFAFILVKREVFEKIHEREKCGPFNTRGFGEDVSFCDRAVEVGFNVFVDTSIEIGHIAEVVIEPGYVRRNRTCEVNPWDPPSEIEPGEPRASIVIPTWNQKPELLDKAIRSALAQTVPVEIIVVDDGSDVPVELPEVPAGLPHRMKLIRIPHAGCFHALNAGIDAMTTDWFCWLSSDDTFSPKKIARQLRATEGAGASCSFHGYRMIFDDGTASEVPGTAPAPADVDQRLIMPPSWRSREEQQRVLASGCCINGLTAMIHRHVFETVGKFDVSGDFSIVADWEMWNRIAGSFDWIPIPEILATRLEHGSNCSTVFAGDSEKKLRWFLEDQRVREMYGPRCPKCKERL